MLNNKHLKNIENALLNSYCRRQIEKKEEKIKIYLKMYKNDLIKYAYIDINTIKRMSLQTVNLSL